MLKDAILRVKILDRTEIDERLMRSKVKLENDLTVTVPNSLIHLKEKVAIPKVIGDWIFKSQLLDRRSLRSALETATIILYAKNGNEVIDWLKDTNNQDIFATAWANGYEDEKEKKYEVILCNGQSLKTVYRQGNDHLDFEKVYGDLERFTRRQLEDAGLSWMFDCPGIKVREVEEEE